MKKWNVCLTFERVFICLHAWGVHGWLWNGLTVNAAMFVVKSFCPTLPMVL